VRVELSAARTCAGVYWINNGHAFDEMLDARQLAERLKTGRLGRVV